MGRSLTFLLTAAVMSATLPAQAGTRITNGSFEQPGVPDGGAVYYGWGSVFRGWNVVGGANVGVTSGDFVFCDHKFPAKQRKQWLNLAGDTGSGVSTGVQQLVRTKPGATYELSFYVGNVVDKDGLCGTTSTVSVLIDNVPIASFTNKAGKGDTQDWKRFSLQFQAENKTTSIALMSADPANDYDDGLDDVNIALVTAP